MKQPIPYLVALACALIVPTSAPAATVVEPLTLPAGDLRLALPAPTGTRLAILAGTGVAGSPHTVLVVDHPCEGSPTRTLVVRTDASWVPQPDRVPQDILRLQWSDDGTQLYAAGTVFSLREAEGELVADELMKIEQPLLDLRFGAKNTAAGVEFVKAEEWTNGPEPKWVITVAYNLYRLSRGATQTISPREDRGIYWVPLDWGDGPTVTWDGDALLIYYPFHTVTERFVPGKTRDALDMKRPDGPPLASTGPFKLKEPCRITWKLTRQDAVDALEITTR